MTSAFQDQLFAIMLHASFDALVRYGLPTLALCGVLTWICARLASSNRRRQSTTRQQRRAPRDAPLPMRPINRKPDRQHKPQRLQKTVLPLSSVAVTRRRPLTPFEERMFAAVTTALPECVVLAQVAFSALITTQDRAHRNRFDRKVADFVICSRQMTPFAIIELDDRSHLGKEAADAQRDALMLSAGYHTLRYPGIPPAEQIRRDVEALLVMLTAPPQPATDLHYL